MCGLIGATGKPEARYLIALGCLSERRGSDSAGVAWQVGERLRIAKIAQNPLVAFPVTLAPAIKHATKYGGPILGHTRQATTGAVNTTNAHPFFDKEAHIAWAHNGIISNYRKFGNFEVDSESLIVGIKAKDFSEFYGPVALLWIEGGKLHAFRKGNPLYRGIRKHAVYVASEQNMLSEIGCKRIKELSEGRMYVWDGIKLESSEVIKPNQSYSSYVGSTLYDGDDGWLGWRARNGGRWDKDLNRWVYDSETGESHTVVHGCRGGEGRRRAPGFHFTPRRKVESEVNGEVPTLPTIHAGTGDTPPESSEDGKGTEQDGAQILDLIPVRNDGGLRTFVKPGMESLEEEIREMEKLCAECGENPKMEGRDYCEVCFNIMVHNFGGLD